MYDQALRIAPYNLDAMFNMGILKYRYGATVSFTQGVMSDKDESFHSESLSRGGPNNSQNDIQEGIQLLHRASNAGHFQAKQFLISNQIMFNYRTNLQNPNA